MLPEGFKWEPRGQHLDDEPALVLNGRHVAFLTRRADGGWLARLACHRPFEAPLVTRQCRSKETGIAGIEAWACRHEATLRAEVAAMPRPRHVGAG